MTPRVVGAAPDRHHDLTPPPGTTAPPAPMWSRGCFCHVRASVRSGMCTFAHSRFSVVAIVQCANLHHWYTRTSVDGRNTTARLGHANLSVDTS